MSCVHIASLQWKAVCGITVESCAWVPEISHLQIYWWILLSACCSVGKSSRGQSWACQLGCRVQAQSNTSEMSCKQLPYLYLLYSIHYTVSILAVQKRHNRWVYIEYYLYLYAHFTFLDVLDGSNLKSSFLYPGIRPGSNIACSSAKLVINVTIFCMPSKDVALWGSLLVFPWMRVVKPLSM